MDEETISLILHGCKLATHLESNIPNLANQPNIILSSCDEIINIFSLAKERLRPGSYHHPIQMIDANLDKWVRSSTSSQSQAMEITQSQSSTSFHIRSLLGEVIQLQETVSGQVAGVGGGEVHSMSDVSDTGKYVFSPQKSRRRKDDVEKRTMRVAAPVMGNTEIPPDDGFTWRKYGQKEILGSRFPRAYYRCTHQKLYQCSAKKQVQRLDDDPFIFQVTYRGEHMCHKSSTAPSISPLQPFPATQLGTTQALPSHFSPSILRYGRESELFPVDDIAEAMFNSGTTSTDNMEFIFPSLESKWEEANKNKKN